MLEILSRISNVVKSPYLDAALEVAEARHERKQRNRKMVRMLAQGKTLLKLTHK